MLLGVILELLARTAQTRIGLKRIDHPHEIIKPDDPFKLKAGAAFGGPDQVSLDPSDLGQADDDTFAAAELKLAFDHEAVRRNIDNVQVHIAKAAVFADHFVVYRVTRRAAHVGYRQLSPCAHRAACLQSSFTASAIMRAKGKDWVKTGKKLPSKRPKYTVLFLAG